MKVILDTNVIFEDFNFRKTNTQILLSEVKEGNLALLIPEIVLDEAVNKYRQRLEKGQKDITSELETLGELAQQVFKSPIATQQVEQLANEYRARLDQLFKDYGITIIPYPTTDHRFLANKAMHKKKPFNSNEKGYRDNLIWENIKSLISAVDEDIASKPEVVFVTHNHTDFMSGDKLHEDLTSELTDQDLHTDTIAVYRSIKECVDAVIKLYTIQAEEFKQRLDANDFLDFKVKDIIIEYLDDEYVGKELGRFEFTSPGDYIDDEREIISYDEDFKIEDLSVKKLNADEFVIGARINVETELEFFVDKSEYYSSRDEDYWVIDANWNDYVVLVGQMETVTFDVTIIVNNKLESQSIELNKVD